MHPLRATLPGSRHNRASLWTACLTSRRAAITILTAAWAGRRSKSRRACRRSRCQRRARARASAHRPERDELEEYLSAPLETDTNLDLLAYWKLKESTWPKLAKMAKQYLAAPFSSAGVERVFSAAGKMHDDLRKSEKDSTLEHSLFAAFNTE